MSNFFDQITTLTYVLMDNFCPCLNVYSNEWLLLFFFSWRVLKILLNKDKKLSIRTYVKFVISESKKATQTLHSIKVVLFDLKSYFILWNICIFRYKVHYDMQGKCCLCISQTLFFHDVQRHLFLQSINNINRRKSEFLNKKVIVCDLEWPLTFEVIHDFTTKKSVFKMSAIIEIFNKIGS